MRIKTDIHTSLLFARHQGGGRNYRGFLEFGKNFMHEARKKFHYQSVANPMLLCSPETVLQLIESDPSLFKNALKELLAVIEYQRPEYNKNNNQSLRIMSKQFLIDMQ